MNKVNLTQQIEAWKSNKVILGSCGREGEEGCFNFYDWFGKDRTLENKAKILITKVITFCKKMDIDTDKHYVFFKENCPMVGDLYTDFRICDIETGDVQYTVTPWSGNTSKAGEAEIWGRSNGFAGPLYEGQNLTTIYKQIEAEKAVK